MDEENNWGIEDMIDFGSPLKPEIRLNDESFKISHFSNPRNNQFEVNICQAMEISKDMSANVESNTNKNNFEIASLTNVNKVDEIWDELKFGKCEVSKLVSSMEKSEIKSSKDSYSDFTNLNQPHKKISEEFPILTKIHSSEGKKESLSMKIQKPNQNLIINKELLNVAGKNYNKSANLNLGFKNPFETGKKKEDIDLEEILGNTLLKK